MAGVILLDTHVLVWLDGGERHRIPEKVQQRLNTEPLAIFPFVRLELAYLYEAGRVTEPSQAVLEDLGPKIELVVGRRASVHCLQGDDHQAVDPREVGRVARIDGEVVCNR